MQVQKIAIDKIQPSPFNARKDFPKEYIAELGASLLQHGQQTPVKVRPKNGGFELIFGECRWRASKSVDLKEIDAIVEQLDDKQAETLCLIENLKRRDLNVFEEAEKLKRLHEVHKIKIEDLAKQVGLSVRSIHDSIKLAKAGKEVRELTLNGKLTVSNAKQIARLPPTFQDACAKEALGRDQWSEPMTHDELEEHIRKTYLQDLRFAPFDIKQKGIPCVAESCDVCPKRSGNCKDEFSDLKSETVCTSPADYQKKFDFFLKQKATELGAKVVPDATADKLFSRWGDFETNHGFLKAHDKHPLDEKNRSYKQLLGKDEVQKRLALCPTPKGEIIELLDSSNIEAAIKAEGRFKKSKQESYGGGLGMTKAEKEKRAKEKAATAQRDKVAAIAIGRCVEKIEQKGLPLELLRLVAETLANNAGSEMDKRRGDAVDVKKMTEKQLLGVTWEAGLGWEIFATYRGISEELKDSCKALGVDLKAAEKDAAAAEKPKTEKAADKKDPLDSPGVAKAKAKKAAVKPKKGGGK